MNTSYIAAAIATASIVAALPPSGTGGASQDEAKPAPGIYLVTADAAGAEQLTRVVGAQPHEVKTTGMAKMILTQGLLKGSMHVELAGPVADLRTASPTPTFRFYFDTSESRTEADPFAALNQLVGGDAMPPGAKTAADFSLVHLTLTGSGRQADMGKIGSMGSHPKNTVDCVQERLAQGVYALRPKNALKPGEYAFFFGTGMNPGGGGFTAWDFGVDQAQ
jgi:hypothetical protein